MVPRKRAGFSSSGFKASPVFVVGRQTAQINKVDRYQAGLTTLSNSPPGGHSRGFDDEWCHSDRSIAYVSGRCFLLAHVISRGRSRDDNRIVFGKGLPSARPTPLPILGVGIRNVSRVGMNEMFVHWIVLRGSPMFGFLGKPSFMFSSPGAGTVIQSSRIV